MNKRCMRAVLPLAIFSMLALGGCSERKTTVTTPTPAPAPAAAPTPAATPAPVTPTSNAPVISPGSGSDVTKKGTETGMIGGEAGTVASSGKPGTGTAEGAGTGAAQSSDSKTENKK